MTHSTASTRIVTDATDATDYFCSGEEMGAGNELLHGEITDQIIGAFFDVNEGLGYGFLENVYKRAMMVALSARGMDCVQEKLYRVQFMGQDVGDYRADLVVAEKVIVEIKTAPQIIGGHEAQLYNYLRASRLQVGLIMNFGRKATYARHILTQHHHHNKRPQTA